MPGAQPIDIGHLLDEGRWGRRQKIFVFLTALTIVFDGVDNQLLGIAIPAMMRDWAVPRAEFRAVLASGMIGMMIGGALAGLIGDRMGRRFALIGSVVIFGILTAAVAFVESLWALGALRFLAGLGLGGAMPNAAALASEYVPRRYRPFAITLTIVCVPARRHARGTLRRVTSCLSFRSDGWRALFAFGGILPLVVAAVLMRFLPESPRYLASHPDRWPELERILGHIGRTVPAGSAFVDLGEQAVAPASVGALFAPDFRRDTVALWGAMFACMLAVYTAFNWVPAMLAGAGLGLSVASNGIAAFNLGGVAGAVCGGLVIARIGSRPTMLSISAAAVAGAVVLASCRSPPRPSAADRHHAWGHWRLHQRHPDHPLRARRARLPDHRSRNRRGDRRGLRPRRRRHEHVRRRMGARRRRQHDVLHAHGRIDDRRVHVPDLRQPSCAKA